jgi:hypothetical protein
MARCGAGMDSVMSGNERRGKVAAARQSAGMAVIRD